jgi:ABC-type dipeptide/oligopeptide/nickel transport system permease component
MAMLFLRRVVQMALILLGVAAITFVLLYALPAGGKSNILDISRLLVSAVPCSTTST